MYSSVHYTYRVVHHIPSTYSWKFVPLTTFIQSPLPSTPHRLVTTNLISFSMSLFVFEV